MKCDNNQMNIYRKTYLDRMIEICPSIKLLPSEQQFMYIMSCCDMDIIRDTIKWVDCCNSAHKEKFNDKITSSSPV